MSRSRKKPYITDQNAGHPQRGRAKRVAARKARYADNVGSGGEYKKHAEPWNIRDWSFHMPKDPRAKRK